MLRRGLARRVKRYWPLSMRRPTISATSTVSVPCPEAWQGCWQCLGSVAGALSGMGAFSTISLQPSPPSPSLGPELSPAPSLAFCTKSVFLFLTFRAVDKSTSVRPSAPISFHTVLCPHLPASNSMGILLPLLSLCPAASYSWKTLPLPSCVRHPNSPFHGATPRSPTIEKGICSALRMDLPVPGVQMHYRSEEYYPSSSDCKLLGAGTRASSAFGAGLSPRHSAKNPSQCLFHLQCLACNCEPQSFLITGLLSFTNCPVKSELKHGVFGKVPRTNLDSICSRTEGNQLGSVSERKHVELCKGSGLEQTGVLQIRTRDHWQRCVGAP